MLLKHISLMLAAVMYTAAAFSSDGRFTVNSPDNRLSVTIETSGNLRISASHDGTYILAPSPVSMTLDNGTVYGHRSTVVSNVTEQVDEMIKAAVYKKNMVSDRYNSLTLGFRDGFDFIVRVYDDGAAYRFVSRSPEPFRVLGEEAGFTFPNDHTAWVAYSNSNGADTLEEQFFCSFENTYDFAPLSHWQRHRLAMLPLLVDIGAGKKICILEADLVDYPGMYLSNTDGGKTLKAVFPRYPDTEVQGGHNDLQAVVTSRKDFIASYDRGTAFPWRAFVVTESDSQLPANDMVYRLARPSSAESGFDWVRPGKVAWEWWNDWGLYGVDFEAGVNNETYRHYIDFASQNGIEYVILDEGWSVEKKADLMRVVPEINLPELIEYATQRNVGIILWAGYFALAKDTEGIFEHYSRMGVKGIKIDFMDRDDQKMVDFHYRTAALGAKYKLLIDFHGTYKPTGLQRTFPNVINFEGVHGLEQLKWAGTETDQVTYDVTMPFIRMVAGPVDYTQGAMRNAIRKNYHPVFTQPMSQGTRCRQLAQYVVFDSPLNMLCDSPSAYNAEPECTSFISAIPTIWDETIVLSGEVGKNIITARRSGSTWYIGGMCAWNAMNTTVNLSFLPVGSYSMEIFNDGANASKIASDFARNTSTTANNNSLEISMAPGGGFAAKLVPLTE